MKSSQVVLMFWASTICGGSTNASCNGSLESCDVGERPRGPQLLMSFGIHSDQALENNSRTMRLQIESCMYMDDLDLMNDSL